MNNSKAKKVAILWTLLVGLVMVTLITMAVKKDVVEIVSIGTENGVDIGYEVWVNGTYQKRFYTSIKNN